MTTMWPEEMGMLNFQTVDWQVRSRKSCMLLAPCFLKSASSHCTFQVRVFNSFFSWIYPGLKQNQLNQQTSQLLCQLHSSFFCRFVKVSAAWVTDDMRLWCHAAPQQGVMILFKVVENTQIATLLNLKIKEECRWDV